MRNSQPNQNDALFGEVIYAYTRANAIADGELVDVSNHARQVGFRLPVALTRSVWTAVECIPERYQHEDVSGRTHDVLWMAYLAARRAKSRESRVKFNVILHATPAPANRREHVKDYVLDLGPGDKGEPVFTIGLPGDF